MVVFAITFAITAITFAITAITFAITKISELEYAPTPARLFVYTVYTVYNLSSSVSSNLALAR